MVSRITNVQIGIAVRFHNILHGFCAVRGAVNAYLESNMLQQLASMREEFLYRVFLNLQKSYDILGRERCMNFLVSYEVGLWREGIL